MKNSYRVIFSTFSFLILIACFWWRFEKALFTDKFALREIFENYSSSCECAETRGITSYYKPLEKRDYGELVFSQKAAGIRQDLNRHEVALVSNLEDGTKLVVTSSKSFDEDTGEFLDCDGCGSWLSIGVFEKINSKWTLINKAVNLYGDGAMGKPPEIYANNKGVKDWFEITVAHYYFHHGEDDEAKVKLVYRKGMWTSVNLLATN